MSTTTPMPAPHIRSNSGVRPFTFNSLIPDSLPYTHSQQGAHEAGPTFSGGLPPLPEVDPFVSNGHFASVSQSHSGQVTYEARSSGAFPATLSLPPVVEPFAPNMVFPNGVPQADPGRDLHGARPLGTSLADLSLPSTPQACRAAPTTPDPIRASSPVPSTPTIAPESFDMGSPDSKRTRITASNPIYGFVEGAKQGNEQYAIFRTRKLRPTQSDAREAGKRFHRGMRDLIVRAENLSKETGAWIFLGGQHVNGAKGYTNYASPRLRRDAKKELTAIQNQFSTMTSALMSSRRREAVELSIALDKANKKHNAAQATLADLQAVLESSDAGGDLSKEAFVAKLKALVAGNGDGESPEP